ncbi:MAG: trypsin-like peptidase domain-containing protein, partial [Kiritimatiellaeota bacterium]|nr:trypsin-like peptidase domain-containing protein [Kiritimatiellota bacterium]
DKGLLITSARTVRLPMSARKTEIRESTRMVKLPSGGELPVRVVLTDADLGAVVLAPENPAAVPAGAFKPVNWATAAKAQQLDPVIIVGRTEKAYGGLPDTAAGKINAVDRKPRLLYICALLASGDGEAAFDSAGKLLGIGIGAQTIVAAEELQDVIDQARRAVAKTAVQKPAAN